MARRLTYVESVIKNRVLYCVWIVLWFQGLSVVGVQQIDRVVEVVEETLKGKLRIAPKCHFKSCILRIQKNTQPTDLTSAFGYRTSGNSDIFNADFT